MLNKKAICVFAFFLIYCASVPSFACSGKGPADPVTGLISYPPGTGTSEGNTTVPTGLTGTPFQGGTYYKGWLDNAMKLIVVPAGTTLAFEGVIETVAGTDRPPQWEEGAVKGVGGTTVDQAPRPEWTISGNGRGDYRDGNIPPTIPGLKFVNFESPPSIIIAADTPNEKALWKLTYDRDTALRVLVSIWNDPLIRATYMSEENIPPGFDMNVIAANAKEPQADEGAKSLNEFEISATGAGGVQALRDGLDAALVQRAGQIVQTGAPISRKFLRSDDTEFTMNLAEEAKVIVKAGYIAMQGATDMDFYPTGRYNTKYYITPPSSEVYEVGKAKLALKLSAPTAPDYWMVDLHSGLESARDCIWCWVEADVVLKPENTKIEDPDDNSQFYTFVPDSYAVGGVFVRGLYQSGSSSAGRNTLVYVVVADTEAPAHYKWEASAVTGKTGATLNSGGPALKFRVFDNNPIIGTDGSHNSIFSIFDDLQDYEFVEASKRPDNAPANADVFSRYLAPVKDGFDEKNLLPTLHYNVCVPAYAGFKVSGEAKNYTGPLPLVNDVLAMPLQKFVWKTAASDKMTISDRRIYDVNGNQVSGLDDLRTDGNWKGYSSYLVTVDPEGLTEPMGFGLADNSVNRTLSIADDLKATAPVKKLFADGYPVDETKVFNFGWNSQALKMFVSSSDGIVVRDAYPDGNIDLARSNRSPAFTGDISLQKILSSKFSGAELAFDSRYPDFLSAWDEPTSVDQLAAKLQANKLVKGGSLGGCNLPSDCLSPDGAWGKINYVTEMTDLGKPNIALEVVNSKNEKAVVYGNLFAMGENGNLLKAVDGAGTDEWAFAADTNTGDKSYSSTSAFYADEAWEFRDSIETDLYLPMKDSMDANAFKPWLFAFDADAKDKLWKTSYWNGSADYNNDKIAFQQGSRDRLVFRYWVWDNVNPFSNDLAMPNGVRGDASPSRSRFKNVSGFVNAEIKLTDVPGYRGEVSVDKVWWPDYIFHNPSSGAAEECSISLKAEDEKVNSRLLKLWFRIVPPSREVIRTIEDKRNRE